jgi:hypothetical protein
LWQPEREAQLHFVHLGTHVATRLNADWPRTGQTVWGGRCGEAAAGNSRARIQGCDGNLANADPMMMITNLRLLGTEGEVLTAHDIAPHLNDIVHRLPWQTEVRQAIEQGNEPAAAPKAEAPPRRGSAGVRPTWYRISGFSSLS